MCGDSNHCWREQGQHYVAGAEARDGGRKSGAGADPRGARARGGGRGDGKWACVWRVLFVLVAWLYYVVLFFFSFLRVGGRLDGFGDTTYDHATRRGIRGVMRERGGELRI